ncbi:MAG: Re/Si-specific NAD(P)(+) transhydrogenase subunit alpha [Acidobacteriota bacterium]
MILGVPAESLPDEHRVALIPAVVPTLMKLGLEVLFEEGAGKAAGFPDGEYQEKGARLVPDRAQLFSSADVLLKVHNLTTDTEQAEMDQIRSGQVLLGLLNPLGNSAAIERLAAKGMTSFALEFLPRISRAQSMDALTSMAMMAGYKASLMAADTVNKMYPLMMTAAGTITPARVFVIGAGVAGLAAIANSHRLGAVVHAYDVRPAVKEQVESLGAKFVELELDTEKAEGSGGYAQVMDEDFYRRQRELMTQVVAQSDVVITTALIPGAQAPMLITEEAVRGMSPGSVIVDLAAEGGGNCELTQARDTVITHDVTIMGPVNLASALPYHASQMYARNLVAFLQNLIQEGEIHLNQEDPIIADTLLTHEGEVVNPRLREVLGLSDSEPAVKSKE